MKHILTLTDSDGVVLARWIIEDDFGDITRPVSRQFMADQIFDEWKTDNDTNKPA